VKRALALGAVLVAVTVAVAVAYQAATRDRTYRALLARGETALREEQTFGAIEAYSGAIALRPDSTVAHLRRAETYQRRGDLDAAARDFRTAAELDPSATRPLAELGDVLYQQQKFSRAIDAYEASLRLDDRSARVSYKLALALYRAGQPDRALAALDQAVRLDGHLADAYYLQGMCLRDTHRLPEAQRALERAVALAPGLLAAREELADLYGALGRHADELEQLQVIAGLDRDDIARHVAVGRAHAQAGHLDLAVLTLGNALERTPGQPLIYAALGQVWLDIATSRGDRVALSKALEALQRVAFSAAAPSEALTLYGRALVQDGQLEAAERILQQASERFPVDTAALPLYARVAERLNHIGAARQALIDYVALLGDNADVAARATHIAALSTRLNDHAMAVAWLKRAMLARPDDRTAAALARAEARASHP
jgi:tetratricopeptide (TPR) repeat protein